MVFSIAYFSTDVLLITPLRCVVVTEKQGIRNNLLRHFHNSAKIDDAKLAALNAAVGAAKTTAEKAAAEAELAVFKPLLPVICLSSTLSPLLSSRASSRI